VILTY